MHAGGTSRASLVILALLLIELTFLLGGGILVLLVLRDKIVHVALGLCELHLIHALACVPMQEGLTPEHRSEILSNAFEHLLDSSRIAKECHGHLQALRWDVAYGGLNVVRNPFHEVR